MEAWLLRIGAMAGAIAAIIGVIKFLAIPISKSIKEEKEHRKKVEKALEDNARHNRENYIAILQLKIMDPHMPLEERVSAGYTYTEVMKQNGPVHLQYEMLQNEYKEKYGKRFQQRDEF